MKSHSIVTAYKGCDEAQVHFMLYYSLFGIGMLDYPQIPADMYCRMQFFVQFAAQAFDCGFTVLYVAARKEGIDCALAVSQKDTFVCQYYRAGYDMDMWHCFPAA